MIEQTSQKRSFKNEFSRLLQNIVVKVFWFFQSTSGKSYFEYFGDLAYFLVGIMPVSSIQSDYEYMIC
jgi:hypothetical protein